MNWEDLFAPDDEEPVTQDTYAEYRLDLGELRFYLQFDGETNLWDYGIVCCSFHRKINSFVAFSGGLAKKLALEQIKIYLQEQLDKIKD